MKILKNLNLIILTLLGTASGVAKIMGMPQEVKFFGDAGFSETLIILFGATQLVGGILLIPQRTRKLGAVIMAITFVISTILIFWGGKMAFGIFSILPILLLGIVIMDKSVGREPHISG